MRIPYTCACTLPEYDYSTQLVSYIYVYIASYYCSCTRYNHYSRALPQIARHYFTYLIWHCKVEIVSYFSALKLTKAYSISVIGQLKGYRGQSKRSQPQGQLQQLYGHLDAANELTRICCITYSHSIRSTQYLGKSPIQCNLMVEIK